MKEIREFYALTQGEMGDYFGVDRSYIAQIEKGSRGLSSKISVPMLPLLMYHAAHFEEAAPDPWDPRELEQVEGILADLRYRKRELEINIEKQKRALKKTVAALQGSRMQATLCELVKDVDTLRHLWAQKMQAIRKIKARAINERSAYRKAFNLMLDLDALEKTEWAIADMEAQREELMLTRMETTHGNLSITPQGELEEMETIATPNSREDEKDPQVWLHLAGPLPEPMATGAPAPHPPLEHEQLMPVTEETVAAIQMDGMLVPVGQFAHGAGEGSVSRGDSALPRYRFRPHQRAKSAGTMDGMDRWNAMQKARERLCT